MADLVEELVSRPGDLELRLVIADRLQGAGDPRGELMAVQCALAAARDPEEHARLRERERVLVRSGLPELDPAVALEWRLGFIAAATVLDRAAELVPALLAHPAARLIEELAVAVPAEALEALGAVLEVRPRPSLLRRVAAGPPAESRRWIGRSTEAWVAPLAGAAPGLAIRPVTHVSQAQLEAEIDDLTRNHSRELWISQIVPIIDLWEQAVLQVRAGCEGALAEVHAAFGQRTRDALSYDARKGRVRVGEEDRTFAAYADLYRGIRALAPFVEDVRFTISDDNAAWVDEFAIAGGELRFVRGFAVDDDRGSKREYWYERVAERPHDEELRRFAARLYTADAVSELEYHVERIAWDARDPEGHRDDVRHALDRAISLDDRDPEIWQLRGRFLRAAGDLEEADRCYARARALGTAPVASFDDVLAAFAAGEDDDALERALGVITASPEHTGARFVAALLESHAGGGHEALTHLAALARVIERRRTAGITPRHEGQLVWTWATLEPSLEELARTGRRAQLLDCYLDDLELADRDDGELTRGAAAYLLAWAEHLRLRGPQPEESARLAERLCLAAAELDPLAGDGCHLCSLLDLRGVSVGEWRRSGALGRATPAHVLAIDPYRLVELAEVHGTRGEYGRAFVLLERYCAMLAAGSPSGVTRDGRGSWRLGFLADRHYKRTCQILQGPPDEAKLARADAAADHGLAILRLIDTRERRELAPSYVLKATIAGCREQHGDALAWADRALACDDRSAVAWSLRARSANRLAMLDEAVASAERAIDLNYMHHPAYHVLACVEAKRGGDREAVLSRLRRVLELSPESRSELAADPDLAPLRDDPAFRALVGHAP